MDTNTAQLFLVALDRIREAQLQQGVLLATIGEKLERMAERPSRDNLTTRLERWMPFLKPIASAAAQYAIGILVIAYAVKGGDLMTAVEALLKLLPSLSR
jgi:hypothetical protein